MEDDEVDALLNSIGTHARPRDSGYPAQSQASYWNDHNREDGLYDEPTWSYPEEAVGHRDQRDYGYTDQDFVGSQAFPRDAFDERMLRLRDDDRQQQAEAGRARLSLAPQSMAYNPRGRERRDEQQVAGRIASQFAYNPAPVPQTSSSPKALPSSPAFGASQRRHSNTQQLHRAEHVDLEETQAVRPRQTHEQQHASYPHTVPAQLDLGHAPPMAQGIQLISTHELPDRFRSIFSFPLFNAVQSKCFRIVYGSGDNFVVSSPTGSGKTVIFELAVLRAINAYSSGEFKIVYQAPTKSLCSERQRDWQIKFGPLGLTCAELTGDSNMAQLRDVQTASIIITTPEKWDSMTRKWKDHEKLMQMVKLFLIDEVHILKEERGATLEAVVSRMKSIDSGVRFVAVSATVPNFADIATWLGKDSSHPDLPAAKEKFGEEFRPVKLQKHVVGFQTGGNDFAFDSALNHRLPDVISRYSQRKPIMIFCMTRKSCVATAKHLATWWSSSGPRKRFWEAPRRDIRVSHGDLRDCTPAGVAVHHAGLEQHDRQAVEQGFLSGDIGVICCTSTLAVGVNLPCHFVILKNTVSWTNAGAKEYSDIEIIQMLGRAGRPQFDDSAIAVIMTKAEKVRHYDKLSSGQEILESCLHKNIIEHLNAEIGLGSITDVNSAIRWLAGTFFYVRLCENPDHYKLDAGSGNTAQERLRYICSQGISLLEEHDLVRREKKLLCTEFGDSMARYCVRFDTMTIFLSLAEKSRLSEILSALVQATELREVRFRGGEKSMYKKLNGMPSIKFPIPVNLDAPAHKASLVIQSVLGGDELPVDQAGNAHHLQFNTDVAVIFQNTHRLIRCIIDCSLQKEDSITSRNALTLARSLSARCWDDSPLQLKQIENIGLVSVRKLVNANIKSIEDLENTEPHRIETILSKSTPYGVRLLDKLKGFPKLRLALRQMKVTASKKDVAATATMSIKAEIGFMNEKTPESYQKRSVFVCMLAETSDGKLLLFRRISAKKLASGQDILFEAELTTLNQVVTCYVMCEEIGESFPQDAGTLRQITLQPQLPPWIEARFKQRAGEAKKAEANEAKSGANISRRRRESENSGRRQSNTGSEDYGAADLDDDELLAAAAGFGGFTNIDDIDSEDASRAAHIKGTGKNKSKQAPQSTQPNDQNAWQPTQLRNGKWACNHACKDKTSCKHICCREGLDKAPKMPAKAKKAESSDQNSTLTNWRKPPALNNKALIVPGSSNGKGKLPEFNKGPKRPAPLSDSHEIDELDLTHRGPDDEFGTKVPQSYSSWKSGLHRKSTATAPSGSRKTLPSSSKTSYAAGVPAKPSFLSDPVERAAEQSSDYGGSWMDSVKVTDTVGAQDVDETMNEYPMPENEAKDADEAMFDQDSQFEDAMVGIADSQNLRDLFDRDDPIVDEEFPNPITISSPALALTQRHPPPSEPPKPVTKTAKPEKSLFVTDTSSSTDDRVFAQSRRGPQKSPLHTNQVSSSTLKESDHPDDSVQVLGPRKRKPADADADASDCAPGSERKRAKESDSAYRAQYGASIDTAMVPVAGGDGVVADAPKTEEVAVPAGYEGVDPWLIEEFGELVEFL